MNARVPSMILLVMALVVASAVSATAAPRPAPRPASRLASGVAKQAAAKAAPKPAAPRTLEDITIQGEIDVPQVLFITGRPRPFYDDRLHRLFQPTTRQQIEALATPGAVCVRPIGPSREASR